MLSFYTNHDLYKLSTITPNLSRSDEDSDELLQCSTDIRDFWAIFVGIAQQFIALMQIFLFYTNFWQSQTNYFGLTLVENNYWLTLFDLIQLCSFLF